MTEPLVEGEVIRYTCEVVYRGGLEPQMKWSGPHEFADFMTNESVPGERVKKSIHVRAGVSNNGWKYDCHIYFNAPQNPPNPNYATNAPTYKYNYTSPPLVVHCKYSTFGIHIVT